MFSNNKLTKFVATGAAVVALAVGGIAIGNSGSSNSASGTTAPASGTPSNVARHMGAPGQRSSQPATALSGQIPKGWTRGSGTLISGAAADKAKATALAAGYKGTVNRVLQLSDGSYVVHLTANPAGPHHVFISKAFKVTGTA
jgi:hypothetical protein